MSEHGGHAYRKKSCKLEAERRRETEGFSRADAAASEMVRLAAVNMNHASFGQRGRQLSSVRGCLTHICVQKCYEPLC